MQQERYISDPIRGLGFAEVLTLLHYYYYKGTITVGNISLVLFMSAGLFAMILILEASNVIMCQGLCLNNLYIAT